MIRMMRKTGVLAVSLVFLGGCGGWPLPEPEPGGEQSVPGSADVQKPLGLVQLIEFHDIQGLRNWAHELDQRGLKALINAQKNILDAYPEDIRWLADQGHEIMGGYHDAPLWDVPYETQLEAMREEKESVESITDKPMRVFGSRYFAYDENTLKAADTLGIEYVLARGTSDVEALVYEPDEYNCKIISVSNVAFEEMGRGSLCDYSLWARGSTASEFEQILDDALAKYPKRIMIVSHAYLGGMKEDWWAAYANFLDGSQVRWAAGFDEWVMPESGVNLRVPLSLIPENREVLYTTPTPSVPLDELEDVDQMYNPCAAPPDADDASDTDVSDDDALRIFHNNSGPMCLAALDWLDGVKLEHPALVVEEHLTYDPGVRDLLIQLELEYQTSQGVSTSFEYLPIVFFQGQAFSGFNDEIAETLQELLPSEASASP